MKSLLRFALVGSVICVSPLALTATTPVVPAATPVVPPAPVAPAVAPTGFSAQQLSDGLKAGLGSMISQALGSGTMTVTPPPALAKIQAAVSKSGNASAGDGFSSALSAAVAQVSPQVADLLKNNLSVIKPEDSQGVLAGGADAATQYLQKAVGPTMREKLLPLVKQAMASSGTATKAKEMFAAAGPFAGLAGNKALGDLDGYVCDQLLSQSFALIGKQEAAVRANPALLSSSPTAQKIFSYFQK